MVDKSKTELYLKKLHELTIGADPVAVSDWAIKEELELDESNVLLDSVAKQILAYLQMADLRIEVDKFLYGIDDYRDWYEESKREYEA